MLGSFGPYFVSVTQVRSQAARSAAVSRALPARLRLFLRDTEAGLAQAAGALTGPALGKFLQNWPVWLWPHLFPSPQPQSPHL